MPTTENFESTRAFVQAMPLISLSRFLQPNASAMLNKRGVPKIHNPNQRQSHCTILATISRGFGGFLSNNSSSASNSRDSLPDPVELCACGSEKQYVKCCRRFHSAQASPQGAEELLRSRYSAYAYRLPSYIMNTTHPSMAELDRRKWKREILDFCLEYRFVGGVDVIQLRMTGPSSTRILFR